MKSGSVSRKPINTDHLSVSNELDESDAKLLYQNYRLGTLQWNLKPDLKPDEFIDVVDDLINSAFDLNISVRYNGQSLGILFGKNAYKFVILGDMAWSPKASPRKKIEGMAAILNEVRKYTVGLFEAEYKYKKFYEHLADRKIVRRVGSLYGTNEKGSRTTFFQTREI
jgi:hypothetical protein